MRLHGDREPKQPQVGVGGGGATFLNGAPNEVWSYGEVYGICKTYMGVEREASERGSPVMRTLF